jgi:hypothetical protein
MYGRLRVNKAIVIEIDQVPVAVRTNPTRGIPVTYCFFVGQQGHPARASALTYHTMDYVSFSLK